jgi:hypothetical protein
MVKGRVLADVLRIPLANENVAAELVALLMNEYSPLVELAKMRLTGALNTCGFTTAEVI